jgi:exonuclease III
MNPDRPPPVLRFFAINVQGLTASKFPAILRWLREKSAHGAILTETQLTTDPFDLLKVTAGGGTIWPGMQTFHVPGTGSTEGVAIVLGPSLHLSNPIKFVHPSLTTGRILRVDMHIHGAPLSVIGVYGPSQPAHRAAFYSDILSSHLPSGNRPFLVAGDFNTVLSDLDCWYPPGHLGLLGPNTRLTGGPELGDVMATHALSDIWRLLHPTANQYTHFSRPAGTGARLDRFLLNDSFRHTFTGLNCTILPIGGFTTDHCPVRLLFHSPPPSVPRGTGILSFPLKILNLSFVFCDQRARPNCF